MGERSSKTECNREVMGERNCKMGRKNSKREQEGKWKKRDREVVSEKQKKRKGI